MSMEKMFRPLKDLLCSLELWLPTTGEHGKNLVYRKPEACTIPHEGKVKITVDAAYSTDEG
jgi:hypothetical protein